MVYFGALPWVSVFVLSYLAKLVFQQLERQTVQSKNLISCWTVCILAARSFTAKLLVQPTSSVVLFYFIFIFLYIIQ